jgi:hypothetical protein
VVHRNTRQLLYTANGFEIRPLKELEVLKWCETAFISPAVSTGNIFSLGVKGVAGWYLFLKVDSKAVRTGSHCLEEMWVTQCLI